ncbi:lipopolysaccharide heptosyltransferase II [Candidatus Omnitrophota bacterium]
MIRRIIRKIRFKPFGILKRGLQNILYILTGAIGNSIFKVLRAIKVIKPQGPFKTSEIKKIVIFRPDRIGDVILATPTFGAIRTAYPEAEITLVVAAANLDLVVANPDLNEIITIQQRGLFKNSRLIQQLRGIRFDLAVLLYPALWSCALAFLARIPQRLGYSFHGNDFLLTIAAPNPWKTELKHEVEVNLDVVRAIGVQPQNKELKICLAEPAQQKAAAFFNQHQINPADKVVVIHPGSFEEYIRWPVAGFAQVAARLIDEFRARVIILGGPGEESLVARVCELMPVKPITALGLTLAQSIALIKRANLFVGNSSGPMHIAAALKVPVVAIFGNPHPLDSHQKWGPYSPRSIVVHKDPGCRNCHPGDCRHYKCMEAISAEDVIQAVKKFI